MGFSESPRATEQRTKSPGFGDRLSPSELWTVTMAVVSCRMSSWQSLLRPTLGPKSRTVKGRIYENDRESSQAYSLDRFISRVNSNIRNIRPASEASFKHLL